jgi:2',3'-cyclic-nucleotide 2'-phosphodiesterase (5'-nucleotidase family)
MTSRFLAAVAAGLLGACGAAGAREAAVTLLHTTDLHGRIVNVVPSGDDSADAGLLRIATRIRTIRAECPEALYVDCGDTIQGTPESLLTRGRIMIDALAALRCDAWAPGNHEFDWGPGVLRALVQAAPFPVLAANLAARAGAAEPPLPAVRPWVLREAGGVRVAIVGVTHPAIPGWLLPEFLGEVEIREAAASIQAVLPDVRAARPDILVLLVHLSARGDPDLGVPGAEALAARFPEFDVILGGHSHEAVAARSIGGALYAQAGCHGAFLGRVDLLYDTLQKRVLRKAGTLLPIDGSIPADPELAALLGPSLARAHRDLDRVRAEIQGPLETPGAAPGDEASARLLRAAIASASGAEVVVHGRLSGRLPADGKLTERDLWRIVPYENRIGLCRLTAGELREILEEALAQSGDRPVLGISGLVCDLDPAAAPGRRVLRILLPDGRAPHARQRFLTAFNSHTLASGGRRHPAVRRLAFLPEAGFALTEIDTRDALRQWLEKHRTLAAGALAAPGYRGVTKAEAR